MRYQIWKHCLFAFVFTLAVVSSAANATAHPAKVFLPYLAEIQSNIPPGFAMRLPGEIKLSSPSDIEESKLFVRVFSSDTPPTFIVSISTCDKSPLPCLVGTFSADRKSSPSAVREMRRYQAEGKRITLDTNVFGYLLEGPLQKPSHRFSSVIWEQDDMMYTVTFPSIERQNILYMAYSMAHETPLRRVVASRPVFPRPIPPL